jgi:hypothetical protein
VPVAEDGAVPGVTTPFSFLQPEWPAVFESATRAALAVHRDPRTACFFIAEAA